MNIKQLESFVCVAEEQNFTRAARLLFMTQPAVSMQIKALEEALGMQLFERTEKTVSMTEAGRILYPEAKSILAHLTKGMEALAELRGLERGTLTVGASTLPAEYLLPRFIGEFIKLYPGVRINLPMGNTQQILQMVREREVDMGVTGAEPQEPGFQVTQWMSDPMVLIVPKDHSLTGRTGIKTRDLGEERWIMREKGSGTRRVIEEHLTTLELPLRESQIVMELESTRAVITAVQAGLGISLVSRWAAAEVLALGGVQEVVVEDLTISRRLYLIRMQNKYQSALEQAFHSFLHEGGPREGESSVQHDLNMVQC